MESLIMNELLSDPLIFTISIIFVVLFGLCFGSFLNVVIYRLPNHMNLAYPPSHCPNCDYKLKWYDNIPVLSYIMLGGKCRNCRQPISPRYIIVEVFTSIMFVCCFLKFKFSPYFFLSVITIMCFICISFIDFEHYIIPDSLNLIIFIVGIVSLFFDLPGKEYISVTLADKLIGFGVALLIFLLILLIERIIKKEIMGGGDLKLICGVSLLLGYKLLLLGIFISSLIACIVEIPLAFNKKLRKDHVLPFGPYLAIGFTITLFFGLDILNFYLSLFV